MIEEVEKDTCGNCDNAEGAVCYYCDGNEGVSTEIIEGGWCRNWKEYVPTLDSDWELDE
jgi:hypothetical protein